MTNGGATVKGGAPPTSLAEDAAAALLHRHTGITRPGVFRLLGMDWDLLPGVYAPHLTRSAALYAEWMPYPVGGAFCEIGCGTGYLSVIAAQRGCDRVAAVDINPTAVDNARRNAERHGVADRMTAACGDLFAPLPGGDRYDVVFWNSNFVDADPARGGGSGLEGALFDPGYRTHTRYLRDARPRLNPGGRLLLGFTDLGNRRRLAQIAAEHGWQPRLLRAVRCPAPPAGLITYQLVQFGPVAA